MMRKQKIFNLKNFFCSEFLFTIFPYYYDVHKRYANFYFSKWILIKLEIFFRYMKTSWESPNEVSPVQNVVLCAVILDEWLKELAAITQEHAIMSLTDDIGFKT